jgi:tRNA threonylcarbamoyl adenosine modification protein (Sua5/YciO/YrdC/YwlC family)
MIEYVIEQNPDDRILHKASHILRSGGLICFPTETNWVVAADPYVREGVDKLYRLRHVDNTKHFTILCENFKMAQEVSIIDDSAFRLLKKIIPGPYTFIFEAQKKTTKYLKASRIDKEVGIRFSPRSICKSILKGHMGPIISTHLTYEMINLEDDGIPLYGALIEDHLAHQIDLIIDPGDYDFIPDSTTIINLTTGIPMLVRQGAGAVDFPIHKD